MINEYLIDQIEISETVLNQNLEWLSLNKYHSLNDQTELYKYLLKKVMDLEKQIHDLRFNTYND